MVIQRNKPFQLWGYASQKEKILVKFKGKEYRTISGSNGKWSVTFDSSTVDHQDHTITIQGNNTIKLNKIVIGDVWICSGQSNMEWHLYNTINGKEVISKADHPHIRVFRVAHMENTKIQKDLPNRNEHKWESYTPHNAGSFSAVGYYFGKYIHEQTKIPIGLINAAWGGTRIEPFMHPDSYAETPELKEENKKLKLKIKEYREKLLPPYLDQLEKWVFQAKTAIRKNSEIPAKPIEPKNPVYKKNDRNKSMFVNYNTMIAPWTAVPIAGVIWYQGEANGGEGISYYNKKHGLIKGWRKAWGAEFPFYHVQLANFQKRDDHPEGGNGWARLREAQLNSLDIPRTGMAVTIDIGDDRDIHPRNKYDVGLRLARWAMRDVYGEKAITVSGPLYKKMQVEGNRIRIFFDHAEKGLMAGIKKMQNPVQSSSMPLEEFAIKDKSNQWHWAQARIDDQTVVVWSDEVKQPVAVRYGFQMNPSKANLYNQEGLPASPFRTDSKND
jgi:sialate O-acetylesterase